MEKNKVEKVYDQIHAPESLKHETFKKIKDIHQKNKTNYSFILSIAAVFIFTFAIGTVYYANIHDSIHEAVEAEQIAFETESSDLLHFQSNQELRNFFEKNYTEDMSYYDGVITESAMSLATNGEKEDLSSLDSPTVQKKQIENAEELSDLNYYQTNTQVQDVDEADIVKTDGNYIYYVTNYTVYIVKADNLNLDSKLDFSLLDNNSRYYPSELFINGNKLVVIGNYFEYPDETDSTSKLRDRIVYTNKSTTKAYIYDISDKTEPKELRQVDIDGNYSTSRLIGDTLYLISSKYMYYNPEMKDEEILPIYYDSSSSDKYKNIECTDIVYNQKANDYVYKTIGAVNINNNDEIIVETFLGYGNTVYCSENNLYLATPVYNEENTQILNSTEIYKFNISDGGLKYICKNIISGNVNNQFSLDEYNGNLRIATTVTIQEKPNQVTSREGIEVVEIGKTTTNNILYVLDENLEVIGELTDFGLEEKIYSVRFIENVAYIVTFEQIDPLFVIDLSDPRNPVMKGNLEIPGYSSYLHPYDENHIIGIGYNVKDNGHGGVTNETIKLSMFDVSNLNNPVEIFTKSLGEGYSYSNVTFDHKLLMYDKHRNLIGFPISMNNKKGRMQDSILILNIDLENKEFKIHSQYTVDNFNYYIRKVIYIGDTLYILCDSEILAFDINTLENIANLQLSLNRNKFTVEDSISEIDIIE